MLDLKKLQKEIFQNKVRQGFNTTDKNLEILLLLEELAELSEAVRKKKDNIGEEIADLVIYCLGLSEMLEINIEDEIIKKISVIKNRKYKKVGNGWTRVKEV